MVPLNLPAGTKCRIIAASNPDKHYLPIGSEVVLENRRMVARQSTGELRYEILNQYVRCADLELISSSPLLDMWSNFRSKAGETKPSDDDNDALPF